MPCNVAQKVAEILIQSQAIQLNTKDLFTFTSGIKSPIYCDNRLLISLVDFRDQIVDLGMQVIQSCEFDIIAGVATAGVPWASFLAMKLKKPLVYIRSTDKSYGLKKKIEGININHKKIFLIEDLISTGKNILQAYQTVLDEGGDVVGGLSIFEYKITESSQLFSNLHALTSLDVVLDVALKMKKISSDDQTTIIKWREQQKENIK